MVEHHVDAASLPVASFDGRREVALAVVHGDVGAELPAARALLLGAGGDDDRAAGRLHELDRSRADPAATAVDERSAAVG